jgi:hypothetical protein
MGMRSAGSTANIRNVGRKISTAMRSGSKR